MQSNDQRYSSDSNQTPGGKIHWTKELCIEEARRYEYRSDFEKGNSAGYSAARRHNWLGEVCAHMPSLKKMWTKERCIEEAKKYQYRNDFAKAAAGAYTAIRRNNWTEEVCSHMPISKRSWTFEKCLAEALKYESSAEFQRQSASAYITAYSRGWGREICSHISRKKKKKWTKKKCLKEARNHKSQSDFRIYAKAVYKAATENGWIQNICDQAYVNTGFTKEEIGEKVMITTNVAKLLRLKRTGHPKGYSQPELGNLLGEKCGQLISNIERGLCKPPLKRITKICELLNISREEFKQAWLLDRGLEVDKHLKKPRRERNDDIFIEVESSLSQ